MRTAILLFTMLTLVGLAMPVHAQPKKLGPDVITTIRGLGYSLEDPEDKRS